MQPHQILSPHQILWDGAQLQIPTPLWSLDPLQKDLRVKVLELEDKTCVLIEVIQTSIQLKLLSNSSCCFVVKSKSQPL